MSAVLAPASWVALQEAIRITMPHCRLHTHVMSAHLLREECRENIFTASRELFNFQEQCKCVLAFTAFPLENKYFSPAVILSFPIRLSKSRAALFKIHLFAIRVAMDIK